MIKTLARNPTGQTINFTSNTSGIHICWILAPGTESYPLWSADGVGGIDVYFRQVGESEWRWLGLGEAVNPNENMADFGMGSSADREFKVYLPSDRRLSLISIDIPSKFTMKPSPAPAEKPVVVYGSSIEQGAGSSRPGMVWPAQFGRIIGHEVINLGFQQSCTMTEGMANLISQIDAAMLVIDCFPNMTSAQIEAQMFDFIDILASARPEMPIYVMQDRLQQAGGPHPYFIRAHEANKAAAMDALNELRPLHSNIYWLPADNLMCGSSDGTIDGSHFNDFGAHCAAQDVAAQIDALN